MAKIFVAAMAIMEFIAGISYLFQSNPRLGIYWIAAGVIAVCMYQ